MIANPVDIHVGVRIRTRRRELGISQEQLAEVLRLTFQQVQKYERGFNRVSASKLYEIGQALAARPAYFFEGLPRPEAQESPDQAQVDAEASSVTTRQSNWRRSS